MVKTCINLFAGAGLSSIGLTQAGWQVTDIEVNPVAHYMAKLLQPHGECLLMDVEDVAKEFIAKFDAIWASPPCQLRSAARTQGAPISPYSKNYLEWSLDLTNIFPEKVVWVENVVGQKTSDNLWGQKFNAHQFGVDQSRNRIIGGRYPTPTVLREYKRSYPGICPTVTATEYKGCASDTRRASRYYGRKITLYESAYHMDLPNYKENVDLLTANRLPGFTEAKWRNEIYTALGNGVPCGMARAFGEAAWKQLS